MLSMGHLFLIFLIVILFFGAKRLPEIARSFGQALNEFKKAKDEVANSAFQDDKQPAAKPVSIAGAKPSEIPGADKDASQKAV